METWRIRQGSSFSLISLPLCPPSLFWGDRQACYQATVLTKGGGPSVCVLNRKWDCNHDTASLLFYVLENSKY